MRIIPKKTKVEMELFKGVGVVDIAVGLIGVLLAVTMLLSNLPYHGWFALGILFVFALLIMPVDDEKVYLMIFNLLKYFARYRTFEQKPEEKEQEGKKQEGKKAGRKKQTTFEVKDITPFTGIEDEFIVYGKEYYGAVVELSSIEFRFLTLQRQNNLIDRVYGAVIRTVLGSETAAMIKIDRPVLFDHYVTSEEKKLEELKEAYIYGMLNDEEITDRVAVIYDRIEKIKNYNYNEKVYVPYHYIAFFHKDKSVLRDQARQLIAGFETNDMECKQLRGKDLAIFLKYNYTIDFDEREILTIRPEHYMDWILPKKIEFTTRMVKYDDVYTHNLRVLDYPLAVGNAWGYKLFNIPNTRVVLKMKPIERYKGIRQIDRAIDELRSQGESTAKTSKILELSEHIDTLAELLVLLQSDNESLFDVNVYVTVYDYELSMKEKMTKEEQEQYNKIAQEKGISTSLKKRVKRSMAEYGFKSTDMFMQQFELYASAMISARDNFSRESRGIHSGSIAAAFPYVYKHIMDKNGINLGNSGGTPVFIDFFKRDKDRVNSNMVIIGKSGSGKSYATKTILSNLAAENSKIFILDPENEYSQLAKNLDGKIIDVGSATQGRLNPFHIITGLADDEEEKENEKTEGQNISFHVHLQFLEEFFKQILPGIETDALEYLNNIVIRMYEGKGIDQDTDLSSLEPEDFPIFDDLYEKILNDFQLATGEYSKGNLRILLNYISKFATGGRNASLWNGESTISTNENFTVFNFQSLLANKNNTIANAQMLLVLKWLDNEIIKNRDYNLKYKSNRKIIVVIDEAHVFIDAKFPIALDFMFQLAKRIRKYNGMQIIITQNVKDFVGTEELARKSTAIINACQYSFIFPLAPNDMHDLCKLYEKAGAINENEQDEIINNGRGRAFVVTSPTNRTSISIEATPEVEALFHG